MVLVASRTGPPRKPQHIIGVPGDLKHALLCRKEGWKSCDKDDAVFEVYSQDVTLLYDKLGSEHCSMPAEMHDFRFEYLTHKVMADINSSGRNSSIFKSWKHAISETLSQMTMDLYGQEVPSSAAYSRQQAFASNLQEMETIEQEVQQLLRRLAFLREQNTSIFMQDLGTDV
jgi:hypothetical protein